MSYVLTKDFDACVVAQSIPSVPIPPGICHFVLEKLETPWKWSEKKNNEDRWRAPHKSPLAAGKNYCKKDYIRPSDQYQWQNHKLEF